MKFELNYLSDTYFIDYRHRNKSHRVIDVTDAILCKTKIP